jgi:hypothetical protein
MPAEWLQPGADTLDLAPALAAFAEQGFARLGRVLSDAGVAALRARADDLMLGRAPGDALFFQHDSATGAYEDLAFGRGWVGPSPAYRKIERLELDPVVRAWIENPLFERVARALVGPDVALYRAMLMNKAAGGGTVLPWHQDGGLFWGVDRAPTLQIWTALDEADAERGAVAFVPGTHRAGLARPAGGNVPADALAAAGAEARAVLVPVVAGEALLIHNHVWHRSGQSAGATPRRALSFCYMDAATRCTRTRRAPRTFTRVFVGGATSGS